MLFSGVGRDFSAVSGIDLGEDVTRTSGFALADALYHSGFSEELKPCPAGTFVNSSGYSGCEKCPPGNFTNLNKLIESHGI